LKPSIIFSIQFNTIQLNPSEFYRQFLDGLFATGWAEAVAVIAGIASVWFSKKENILVYPVGLINTVLYVIISANAQLYGEAAVNIYYTIMSVYGWYQWKRKDINSNTIINVSVSDKSWFRKQLVFFIICFISIYLLLQYMKNQFAEGAIPWADALASAAAFTAMWLMTQKKVESWWWWILTNIVSVPLYFVKGFVFTSVYYSILLVLAITGLISWREKANKNLNSQE
jgi:nicotinamide mononucleotide transporter